MKWLNRHKFALGGPFLISLVAGFFGIVTSPLWLVVVVVAAWLGDKVDKPEQEKQAREEIVHEPMKKEEIEERMRELEEGECASSDKSPE